MQHYPDKKNEFRIIGRKKKLKIKLISKPKTMDVLLTWGITLMVLESMKWKQEKNEWEAEERPRVS